jgi:putative spermidine/putrescine transport system ATP-binding protein
MAEGLSQTEQMAMIGTGNERARSPADGHSAKLVLAHVSKHYGHVRAVDDVCLEVQEGEFLTLLGPSGSGKSTLLQIIAGLIEPTTGEVWIDGKNATHIPPYQRDIGMVFQNYALFPHMTIGENIAFPLRMRRVRETETRERVRAALELVRLTPDVSERYPWQLSGGQQQRVALARALVYSPSILLLDEPLGALDKKLRDQMRVEIRMLQRKLNITTVFVTHDQEEAMSMSDRICVMHNGRVEQIGSPVDIYCRPATRFVADFIGESNMLRGRLVGVNPEFTVEWFQGYTLRVDGLSLSSISLGDEVNVIIRPESVKFIDQPSSHDNVIPGMIRDVMFVGAITRFWVELVNGDVMIVTTLSGQHARYRVGDRVYIGWESKDAVILPAFTL